MWGELGTAEQHNRLLREKAFSSHSFVEYRFRFLVSGDSQRFQRILPKSIVDLFSTQCFRYMVHRYAQIKDLIAFRKMKMFCVLTPATL